MSRIMVVDDDPAGQRLIKYMLAPDGHEVFAASNGIEGLQKASREVPDLIVLDVMLPGLDGFEVCHRLRSAAKTARIPVVMLSGKAQATDRDTGLKVGADEYLIKPVERKQLLDIVNKLLARKEEAPEKRARVIGFIGARGGVGTTTVITSVSVAMAGAGHCTVLVDLTPSFGGVADLMGLKAVRTIAGLPKGGAGASREEMEAALTRHSSGVCLLSGEQGQEESGPVTPDSVKTVLEQLGSTADYVLIDISAAASELTAAALAGCDFVNLVTGPRLESLAKAGGPVDRLTRLGVGAGQLGLVIVDRSGAGLSDQPPVSGLPVTGVIPFGAGECAEAEEKGTPVVLAAPESAVAAGMRKLAEKLISLKETVASR